MGNGRAADAPRIIACALPASKWFYISDWGSFLVGALESKFGWHVLAMRKVAAFGNAGAGKSTLARRLAEVTGLSLYPVDTIKFRAGGSEVPHEEYLKRHADLLNRDQWIIEGFGCVTSAWERFSAADALVYIDLPLLTHFRWVTKRLVKGILLNPECWPRIAAYGAARWPATGCFGSVIAG